MFLSVTECNWFCQGQSIAPRQARSAADGGSVTVKLAASYRETTQWICVCGENGADVMEAERFNLSCDPDSH